LGKSLLHASSLGTASLRQPVEARERASLLVVVLGTGLRRQELLGLTRERIVLDAHTLSFA